MLFLKIRLIAELLTVERPGLIGILWLGIACCNPQDGAGTAMPLPEKPSGWISKGDDGYMPIIPAQQSFSNLQCIGDFTANPDYYKH